MAKTEEKNEAQPETAVEYVAQDVFWYGPKLIEKDDTLELTPTQAQYYVPHLLKPKEPKAAPKSAAKAQDEKSG